MRRAAVWLALASGAFGSLLDWVHVHTGTTAYATPFALGLAWWVPLLFAGAGLAIGLSHAGLERLVVGSRPAPPGEHILAGVVILLALWAATGALPWPSGVIAALLATVSLSAWWILDGTPLGLALAAATALIGTLIEIGLVQAGVFRYERPDMGPVASWLPWLYVTASVAVGNLGRALWR